MFESAVMISIKPTWCDRIFTFKDKNLELRKSYPKALRPPFVAFVYCTAKEYRVTDVIHKGDRIWTDDDIYDGDTPIFIKVPDSPAHMMGHEKKVIGKIIVDRIYEVDWKDGKSYLDGREMVREDDIHTCVSVKEFKKYQRGGKVYGWHIQEAEKFIKDRELSMFGLKRPPQSWQYLRASDPWDKEETDGKVD